MKKIITTIILALLTSPAFADFKFVKHYSERTQRFSYSVNNIAINTAFIIFLEGNYITIRNKNEKDLLSSRTKKVSIKFDQNKPGTCSYPDTQLGIAWLNSNCYKWMVENMKVGKEMTIQYFSKREEFIETTISLKGFAAAYRDLENVTIR